MKVDFRDTWAFKFGFVFAAYGIIYFILAFGFVRTVFAEYLIPSFLWVGLGGTLILISRFSNSMSGIRGIWDHRTITWRIGLISFWLTIIYSLTDLFKFEREHVQTLKYHQPKTYLYFLIGILFLLIGWLTDKSIPKPKFHKTWSFKLGLIFLIYALFFGILAPDSSSSILPGLIAYISVCAAAGIALIVHGIILKKLDGQKGLWKGRTWNWRLGLLIIFFFMMFLTTFVSLLNVIKISDTIINSLTYGIIGSVLMLAEGIKIKELPPGKLGLWRNRPWSWRCGLFILSHVLFILLTEFISYIKNGRFSLSITFWMVAIIGASLIFHSKGKQRKELPTGKKGIWEGQPQLWKIGLALIVWDSSDLILSIIHGSITSYFSSLESVLGNLANTIIGIILIIISTLRTRKEMK